ncbi:MAG: PDZ domain-containing protein [Bacteroidetes bacterium]|nr:PDZ domain-containing protein [Bacteroidota bacterium]
MKFILLTLVLVSSFLLHQAQEKTDKNQNVIIETIVEDGDKKEKTVKVISGDNIKDIQSLIDSVMKSVDWKGDGLSKLNIISIPGTDGIETVNWFELNDLGEIGDMNFFEEQMNWLKFNKEKGDKPFLGVIIDTDNQLERGIHVMDIVSGSAAEEAGLEKDDILLSIGKDKINSLDDLIVVLKGHKIGDEISLLYSRMNSETTTKATLKSLQDSNYDLTNSFDNMLPDCCKADPGCKHTSDKVYQAFIHQQRPKLGVQIENLDQEMIDDLRIIDEKGVLVTKVLEESTAKKMGIKVNDVLINLNDDQINDIDALNNILGQHKLGDEIRIDVIRYGVNKSLSGVLFEFNHHSTIDQMLFFGKEE